MTYNAILRGYMREYLRQLREQARVLKEKEAEKC